MIDNYVDRFLGEIIDDGQALQPSAVFKGIADKIDRPNLVGAVRDQQRAPLQRHTTAFSPPAHLQLIRTIQSMDAFNVHLNPFSTQHRMDASIAKTTPLRGELPDPCPQLIVVQRRTGFVVQNRARQPHQVTGATFGDARLGPHGLHCRSPRLRAYRFPRATTFSASMSSIASASSFFSLPFSPSSSRRRRASATSIPPSRPRHL